MIPAGKHAAILLATLACMVVFAFFPMRARLHGQTAASRQAVAPSGWSINRTLVVLDAAHGGSDSGAALGDHQVEKDTTLAIVSRLRAALTTNGFTVITTRDADVSDPLSTDQRAEIANRTHAMACLVIHATTTGSGLHIYTSALQSPASDADVEAPHAYVPVPWATAQEAFVRQSLILAGGLSTSLGRAHLPALIGQAPMRPLDNLMCPAVAIEVAPLLVPGVGATSAADVSYQQQVANTLAVALRAWRDSPDLSPAAKAGSEDGQATAQGSAIAAAETAGRAAAKVRKSSTSAASASSALSTAQRGPQ